MSYLIRIKTADNKSLIDSIWEIDEKGEIAICINPNKSNYKLYEKIPCKELGNYSSKRMEILNENL